jgi:CRP-like cAMP-binding protein
MQFLRQVPLFAGLGEPALNRLAQASHLRRVPAGFVLFNQGDAGTAAYIVQSGSITIVVNTPDGHELVLNDMRAGDCFGEMSLVADLPRSASAIAGHASEVVVIPRGEFLNQLAGEPRLMRRVMETLCRRLGSSAERESALAFLHAPTRLARVLLELDREGSARGFLTVSQEELSRRAGITRQTTVKILARWRRSQWVMTGRGKIMLLNRAAIRQESSDESG